MFPEVLIILECAKLRRSAGAKGCACLPATAEPAARCEKLSALRHFSLSASFWDVHLPRCSVLKHAWHTVIEGPE